MVLQNFFKKYSGVLIAILLYILDCVTLWFVKYRVYGGAVDSMLLYVALFPPVYFLGWFLRDVEEKSEKKEGGALRKINRVLNVLLGLVVAVFFVYSLYINPYDLKVYVIGAAALYIGIIFICDRLSKKKPRERRALFVSILFAVIILSALLYIAVSGTMSVGGAERLLENEGYSEILYDKAYNYGYVEYQKTGELRSENGSIFVRAPKNELLGAYLFRAERDGEVYGVFVSVVDGRIEAALPAAGNPSLFSNKLKS